MVLVAVHGKLHAQRFSCLLTHFLVLLLMISVACTLSASDGATRSNRGHHYESSSSPRMPSHQMTLALHRDLCALCPVFASLVVYSTDDHAANRGRDATAKTAQHRRQTFSRAGPRDNLVQSEDFF